ncbi:mitochondrial import inner membrane translocase subunit Tim21-like isoform X1 [Lytechinus variegatus]|uniref:mitochondrial import inner membrane translocase subunit Tim21-like isoform X1 n=1 Tax=Lytechinus variegatus TaxID=7654 RepID=UPI001BB15944|nr:mitochondrial import inner membrane translocase subunit Tim21-like isoform X1 [Lytechinus variegatus]
MLNELSIRGTQYILTSLSNRVIQRCTLCSTRPSSVDKWQSPYRQFTPTRPYCVRQKFPDQNVICHRWFSTTTRGTQQRKAVTERKSGSDGQQLTIGKRVAQTSKDASYAGIIVLGVGITGLMFYTLGKELFSSDSPNGIYTKAYKLCKNNVEIQDALGTPIKGYGEMTRRKRRRHVSHLEYSQEGVNFMRMKFYLEGPERKATVHLEMKQNESGRYEYRYLFVELDGHPKRTIILEDNR